MLSKEEMQRYARHLLLSEVGIKGQEKLKLARVLCIGAGGLGCPALLYLTSVGVGHIGIVDGDTVETSNLSRQILFTKKDLGKNKSKVAAKHLNKLNSNIKIDTYSQHINKENILAIIDQYDFVIDATDNFQSRYLISDACCTLNKPNIHSSIMQFEGLCTVFSATKNAPCYRCLFPTPPTEGLVPNCAEGGVLGVLPGLLGTLQATEAIKLILNIGEPLIGKIARYNALKTTFSTLHFSQNENCISCGKHACTFELLPSYQNQCAEKKIKTISPKQLQQLIQQKKNFTLLDVREDDEHQTSYIDGSIHIPLKQLQEKYKQLNSQKPIIVYCKLGNRSAKAVEWLNAKEITQASSLEGGIVGWECGN